jgi:hypothetical protein
MLEWSFPPGWSNPYRSIPRDCPGCGRPFTNDRLLILNNPKDPFDVEWLCRRCYYMRGLTNGIPEHPIFFDLYEGFERNLGLLGGPVGHELRHYACELFGHPTFTADTVHRLWDWLCCLPAVKDAFAILLADVVRHLRDALAARSRTPARQATADRPANDAGEAGGAPDQPDIGQLVGRVALATGDENTGRVLAIAARKDWSVARKMEDILRVDRRFEGKTSSEWADLLGVTAGAVRLTGIWAEMRRRRAGED